MFGVFSRLAPRLRTLAAGGAATAIVASSTNSTADCLFGFGGPTADWGKIKNEIVALCDDEGAANPSVDNAPGSLGGGYVGPMLVRLAWHSCGSYGKATNDGGSNGGTIRMCPESNHGGNAGLKHAIGCLSTIKENNPGASWADLIVYASSILPLATLGYPSPRWHSLLSVPWWLHAVSGMRASSPSRIWAAPTAASPPAARTRPSLTRRPPRTSGSPRTIACRTPPRGRSTFVMSSTVSSHPSNPGGGGEVEADLGSHRESPLLLSPLWCWCSRCAGMGFSDQEIVALSGAHAIGRCHTDRSGFWGPWTYAESAFSNDYYKFLLEKKWTGAWRAKSNSVFTPARSAADAFTPVRC